MYTRERFQQQRAARRLVERQAMRGLAFFAVGLGVAQLLFIRWIETQLEHSRAVAIEGAVFLGYIAIFGWLLWRMQRRGRATRFVCPHCGAVLDDPAERIAAATGRCDSCGGQVVEAGPQGSN
jgi:predicted RNA-binding Zn-ribbon protein involved in translation (DUF1610 family)